MQLWSNWDVWKKMMNVLVNNIENADLYVATNTAIGCRRRTESDFKTFSKPITSQPARWSTIWTGARTIPHVITAHSKDHHTHSRKTRVNARTRAICKINLNVNIPHKVCIYKGYEEPRHSKHHNRRRGQSLK